MVAAAFITACKAEEQVKPPASEPITTPGELLASSGQKETLPDIAADELINTPASASESEAPKVYNAKISVTGDLMVHQWQLDDAKKKGRGDYAFDYCFEHIKDYLSNADYTIGNLETTFPGEETGYSDFPIFGSPDSFAEALKNAGFDLLTTANNHCNDRREKGIIRTLDVLDSLDMDHIGTYRAQQKRDTIFIKEINGISFAFISFTYGTNGIPLTKGKNYLANNG